MGLYEIYSTKAQTFVITVYIQVYSWAINTNYVVFDHLDLSSKCFPDIQNMYICMALIHVRSIYQALTLRALKFRSETSFSLMTAIHSCIGWLCLCHHPT